MNVPGRCCHLPSQSLGNNPKECQFLIVVSLILPADDAFSVNSGVAAPKIIWQSIYIWRTVSLPALV